jgi:hypothetical protein
MVFAKCGDTVNFLNCKFFARLALVPAIYPCFPKHTLLARLQRVPKVNKNFNLFFSAF